MNLEGRMLKFLRIALFALLVPAVWSCRDGGSAEVAPTRAVSRPGAATTPGSQSVDASGRSLTFPDSWNSIEGAVGPPESSFVTPEPVSVAGRFQPPLELWTTTLDAYGDPRREGLIHGGIDIGLEGRGGSELKAPCAGVVSEVGANDSYGLFVTLDCGDGWITTLGFVGEVQTTVGARVQHSTVIALSDSTGSHAHLELRYNGTPVNPANYMDLPEVPVPTPLPTLSPTPTATTRPGSSPTATVEGATTAPSATNVPAATPTPSATPTATRTPGPQPTAMWTPTRTPTRIAPPAPTPTIPILR